MRYRYSDPLVAPNDADAPEVTNQAEDKIVVPYDGKRNEADAPEVIDRAEEKIAIPHDNGANAYNMYHEQPEAGRTRPRSRVKCCGLECSRRFIYGVIVLVVLLAIAAAVGGGVGGTLASHSDESVSNRNATQLTSSTTVPTLGNGETTSSARTTTTTATSATISTSTIVVCPSETIDSNSPSETVYSDCPSSNNTIYSLGNGKQDSPPILFRKLCGFSYADRSTNPGEFVGINQKTKSLNECIGLCVAQNTLNATLIESGEYNPCNAVCWRNSAPGDDFPYQCFGGYTKNATDGFDVNREEQCDSAAWMNSEVGV